jgi:hypothetical protein
VRGERKEERYGKRGGGGGRTVEEARRKGFERRADLYY